MQCIMQNVDTLTASLSILACKLEPLTARPENECRWQAMSNINCGVTLKRLEMHLYDCVDTLM